jgi:translation initiation factor IF-2
VLVFRNDEKVGEGKVENLQKGKDSVTSAPEKSECGLGITGQLDLQVGDSLEFWITETKLRKL